MSMPPPPSMTAPPSMWQTPRQAPSTVLPWQRENQGPFGVNTGGGQQKQSGGLGYFVLPQQPAPQQAPPSIRVVRAGSDLPPPSIPRTTASSRNSPIDARERPESRPVAEEDDLDSIYALISFYTEVATDCTRLAADLVRLWKVLANAVRKAWELSAQLHERDVVRPAPLFQPLDDDLQRYTADLARISAKCSAILRWSGPKRVAYQWEAPRIDDYASFANDILGSVREQISNSYDGLRRAAADMTHPCFGDALTRLQACFSAISAAIRSASVDLDRIHSLTGMTYANAKRFLMADATIGTYSNGLATWPAQVTAMSKGFEKAIVETRIEGSWKCIQTSFLSTERPGYEQGPYRQYFNCPLGLRLKKALSSSRRKLSGIQHVQERWHAWLSNQIVRRAGICSQAANDADNAFYDLWRIYDDVMPRSRESTSLKAALVRNGFLRRLKDLLTACSTMAEHLKHIQGAWSQYPGFRGSRLQDTLQRCCTGAEVACGDLKRLMNSLGGSAANRNRESRPRGPVRHARAGRYTGSHRPPASTYVGGYDESEFSWRSGDSGYSTSSGDSRHNYSRYAPHSRRQRS